MNPKAPKRPEEIRHRQQLTAEIRAALRELGIQLALLNHHVSARLELKDVDLDCLNLVDSHGPLSPGALARRSGLHPATTRARRKRNGTSPVRRRAAAERACIDEAVLGNKDPRACQGVKTAARYRFPCRRSRKPLWFTSLSA